MKGTEFKSDISREIPDTLLLDEVRIRQILINLVGNALKFTSQGHVKISVYCRQKPSQVSPRQRSRWEIPDSVNIVFEVEDTGIGIPEDQQELIFENFRQQDGQATRKYGGTGLGLAITKKLTELMEGEISVESEVGRGSIFRVVFPDVRVGIELDTAGDFSEQDEIHSVIRFGPADILVVDDIRFNREIIRAYLKDAPFSITEAKNGEQALALLVSHQNRDIPHFSFSKPDLILMDLRMPGKNGYEVTRIIRNNDELKHIPVIAVTASAMKETEEEVSPLCDGYLRKPFSRSELLAEIRKHLPHTVEDARTGPEEKAAAWERGSGEAISPEIVSRLRELIQILENEFVAKWEEIRETLIFDEIEDFTKWVNEHGMKYACLPVTVWSETVNRQMENFDMDALPGTFAKFPEIIEELRKITDAGS